MLILISPVGVTNAGIAIEKKPMKEYIVKTWSGLKTSSDYPMSRDFVVELIKAAKRNPALYYSVHKN